MSQMSPIRGDGATVTVNGQEYPITDWRIAINTQDLTLTIEIGCGEGRILQFSEQFYQSCRELAIAAERACQQFVRAIAEIAPLLIEAYEDGMLTGDYDDLNDGEDSLPDTPALVNIRRGE